MNIIVHYPKTQEGQTELNRKAAYIHAQTVFQYVQQLSCSTAQKQALIKGILNAKKEDNSS